MPFVATHPTSAYQRKNSIPPSNSTNTTIIPASTISHLLISFPPSLCLQILHQAPEKRSPPLFEYNPSCYPFYLSFVNLRNVFAQQVWQTEIVVHIPTFFSGVKTKVPHSATLSHTTHVASFVIKISAFIYLPSLLFISSARHEDRSLSLCLIPCLCHHF